MYTTNLQLINYIFNPFLNHQKHFHNSKMLNSGNTQPGEMDMHLLNIVKTGFHIHYQPIIDYLYPLPISQPPEKLSQFENAELRKFLTGRYGHASPKYSKTSFHTTTSYSKNFQSSIVWKYQLECGTG